MPDDPLTPELEVPVPKGREIFSTEHLKADLKGRSVRGGALIVGGQMIRYVLNLATIAALGWLVLPEEHGLVGMVTAVTGFVMMFKDLGLSMATVQRPIVTHEQISTLFWFNVMLSVVLMLITFGLAPGIVWFYDGETRLLWITMALGVTFIFSGVMVQHQALLRRTMQFRQLTIMSVVSKAVGAITGIVMAFMGFGYWAIIGMTVAGRVSNALMAWMMCPWRPGLPKRGYGTLDMLKFGGNITTTNIADYWARHLDNVLIGKFHGSESVGHYTRAYSILLLPVQMAAGPMGSVAIAALSRVTDQPKRYRNAFLMVYKKMTLFFLPAVTALVTLAGWVIGVVLGPNWAPAVPIFQALTAVALYQPIITTSNWLFITQDRTGEMLRVRVVNSIISIIAISVAAVLGGPVEIALSYAFSGLFIRLPIELYVISKKGPVTWRHFGTGLVGPLIAAGVVFGVLYALVSYGEAWNPFVGLGVGIPLSVMVTLVVYTMMPNTRAEMKDAVQMFKDLKRKKKISTPQE